jgi:hypothetical protein
MNRHGRSVLAVVAMVWLVAIAKVHEHNPWQNVNHNHMNLLIFLA